MTLLRWSLSWSHIMIVSLSSELSKQNCCLCFHGCVITKFEEVVSSRCSMLFRRNERIYIPSGLVDPCLSTALTIRPCVGKKQTTPQAMNFDWTLHGDCANGWMYRREGLSDHNFEHAKQSLPHIVFWASKMCLVMWPQMTALLSCGHMDLPFNERLKKTVNWKYSIDTLQPRTIIIILSISFDWIF